jgi:hypothetical protein
LNRCPTYWQYEQVIIPTPWYLPETSLWCESCDLSPWLSIDLIGQVHCWYVISYRTTVGCVWGSTCSKFGMEINWLKYIWSMWQNCSNLLNNWSCSTSKFVGTKLILMFNGWFWKLAYVAIGVGASILGKL